MISAPDAHIDHSDVIAQWTRVGAGFNGESSDASPDLERLLLETARITGRNPRLFTMAATWLSKYGDLIAKHRLARLISQKMDSEGHSCLGLLLDIVKHLAHTDHFNGAIHECAPALSPQPLFDVERKNRSLWRLAERRASNISRRWNLWTIEVEPKYDALRTPSWIMKMNPGYRERAALKGDLRASIVEVLRQNPSAGGSESELSRQTGANRTAVRDALDNLELMDRIKRHVQGNRSRIALHNPGSVHAA